MKITVTRKDVIWSYVGTVVPMCTNIIVVPFVLLFLNSSELGLWYIFASISGIAVLFDFGFSVTFARNITYCWAGAKQLKKEEGYIAKKEDTNFCLMKSVMETCRSIYFLISFIVLVLLLTVGTTYIMYIAEQTEGVLLAWLVYAAAIFLNLYYGYFAAFLRGVGAVGEVNKITTISKIIQIGATVLLLYTGFGLLGTCIAYLFYGIVFRLYCKHRFFEYKDIGIELGKIKKQIGVAQKKELFSVIWHNAWKDGLVNVSNYICNQMSTIVCSLFLSLEVTGVYSLGVQIASVISTVAATLYSTYQPELQSAYITGNKNKMKDTMAIIVVSYIILFLGMTLAATWIGLPILRIIKPESIVSTKVLLGLCVYQFILKFRNCYTSYLSCTNRLPYIWSFLICSILGVLLSFVTLQILELGIWGVIFSQIISQIIFNFWYWPMKVHKELKCTFFGLIKIGIGRIKNKINSQLAR